MTYTPHAGLVSRRIARPLLVILGLVAGPLLAQSAPPPAASFGETLEVRVVNIEVVVVDRQGNRVSNLAPSDFKLLVDGKPTPIEYFTEVRGGEAVATTSAAGASAPQNVPALAPGNPVGTSYLVFIDDLFALERDRNRALDALRRDVAQLGPEDRMAIVAYDGKRLDMLSNWSQSIASLEHAMQKAEQRPAHGLQRLSELRTNDRDRELQRRGMGFGGPFANREVVTQLDLVERAYADQLAEQAQGSVGAAVATLRSFAQPPGRKVMLLLSGGWPYMPAEYAINDFRRPVIDNGIPGGETLYRPLADTANLLGYTVYPVDVPGLQGSSADAEQEAPVETGAPLFGAASREQETETTLRYIAQETGGEAMINGRRDVALARAQSDTRSYYWLGFTPSRHGDDKRSVIKVTVLKPGLKVRSRDSFLDLSKRREVTMAVESALLFGNPPTTRPLTVEVGKPAKAGIGNVKLPLTISIPLDAVTMLPVAGQYVADLELRVAALDDAGRHSDVPVLPFQITGKRPAVAGQQAKYETTLELRKTRQQIVVAVYDKASGALLSSTLEVAP